MDQISGRPRNSYIYSTCYFNLLQCPALFWTGRDSTRSSLHSDQVLGETTTFPCWPDPKAQAAQGITCANARIGTRMACAVGTWSKRSFSYITITISISSIARDQSVWLVSVFEAMSIWSMEIHRNSWGLDAHCPHACDLLKRNTLIAGRLRASTKSKDGVQTKTFDHKKSLLI